MMSDKKTIIAEKYISDTDETKKTTVSLMKKIQLNL